MTRFITLAFVVVSVSLPSDPRFIMGCVLLTWLMIRNRQLLVDSLLFTTPLIIIVLLAIVMTAGTGAQDFAIAKGLWYLTRPTIYLLLGYFIAVEVKDPRALFLAIVVAGLLSAADYILKFVTDPNIGSADRTYVRRMIGKGSMLSSVALTVSALAAAGFLKSLKVPWWASAGSAAVCLLAIIVSQSRSGLVVAIAVIPFLYIIVRGRLFPALTASIALLLFVVTTPLLSGVIGAGPIAEYSQSAPEFLNEILAIDRNGKLEVSAYWRGYESFLAYNHVAHAGVLNYIFGVGLAEEVRLPFEMKLGSESFISIPKFHNGYSLLIVRGGLMAVILMAIQVAMLAWRSSTLASAPDLLGTYGLMSMGVLLITVINMPVNAGLYNSGGHATLLLGCTAGFVGLQRHLDAVRRRQKMEGQARSVGTNSPRPA